jgi:type I restriction-modification system DNA methylase subunit
MSSYTSGEGEIRKAIIEADLVDCMLALPGQLFYSTQIPVCLRFIARDKKNSRFRDRRGQTLFINARRHPLELLDFGELLDDALKAMSKLLDDPKASALTKLRFIEEIFDRDPPAPSPNAPSLSRRPTGPAPSLTTRPSGSSKRGPLS